MKRSPMPPPDPAKVRAMQARAARKYQEKREKRARETGAYTSLASRAEMAGSRKGTPQNRHARINAVNAKRREAERERAYGPAARRAWSVMQPCATCSRHATAETPNQQSHIRSGGMGRKSDARFVISQCDPCHRAFHHAGSAAAFERERGMEPGTLDRLAAAHERAWLASL